MDFAQDSLIRNDCGFRSKHYDYEDNLCNESPWIMVFEDDFDGHGLDKSVWFDSLTGGFHLRPGNEQQYYTFDGSNYEVANGILKMIAKVEDPSLDTLACNEKDETDTLSDGIPNRREFRYSSCNIETRRKFSFGKFVARVRLPKGKGFWPAFWLLNPGPRYNELDIFEFMNEVDPKNHIMTSHFESVEQKCSKRKNHSINFSDNFNDFGVKWERNSIRWYVNGDRKWKKNKLWGGRCKVKENMDYDTRYTQPEDPMRIILNLAIEGNEEYPNNSPDANTPFPSKLRVDWVRVWYRMDLGNIVISTPSQCILHDKLFNAVTGNNITINCNYVVPAGQQLSLSASDTVILKSGFVAEAGSVFNARSKQPVYDDRGETDDEDYTDELADYATDNQMERDDISADGFHLSTKGSYSISNGLYVYPNPNRGVFRVQLPSSVHGKCSVSITDLNGHPVFATETDGAENLTIDISTLPQGMYLLHAVGLNSEFNNFQKIVVL